MTYWIFFSKTGFTTTDFFKLPSAFLDIFQYNMFSKVVKQIKPKEVWRNSEVVLNYDHWTKKNPISHVG